MVVKKLKKIKSFFLKHCCLIMSIVTSLMILFEPVLRHKENFLGILFLLIINALIFILGPYVLSGKKKILHFSLFCGALILCLSFFREVDAVKVSVISLITQAVFLLMCFILTVTAIYYSLDKKRQWSSDRIFGLVYGYLLLGVLMSEVYFFLGRYGHAYFLNGNELVEVKRQNCLYFSYVVQTTMGFGDIVPGNEFVRRVVILHACAGVLYTAVLIGRVIGWYGSKPHDY
ncbi:potassium channel family protein [Lentisphaerota bacterium WC36G]|nr:potassium channel family protein [Lentisphaerae bacterium WC36]